MKSKQAKQESALNRLISQAEDLRTQRARLQSQSLEFVIIAPCDNEIRIAQEINRLNNQFVECPF